MLPSQELIYNFQFFVHLVRGLLFGFFQRHEVQGGEFLTGQAAGDYRADEGRPVVKPVLLIPVSG